MIPLSKPHFFGREVEYVTTALAQRQLSGGAYVVALEDAFAHFVNAKHAISCSTGTAALHLLLRALCVGPGDEVIVPSLTYIATANAVTYCGATPVFADVDPLTWTLDPEAAAAVITPRTVGILAVHLYGVPAPLDKLTWLAHQHSLWLAEDAAEAHGSVYQDKPIGSTALGAAAFSFFGSKTLACGEGGMVTTNNARLADAMRRLRGQGVDPTRKYWHTELGYNYRLSELSAAVALGQVETAAQHVTARARLWQEYQERLPQADWQRTPANTQECRWLAALRVPKRDKAMRALEKAGIETRPAFPPLHTQPVYIVPGSQVYAAQPVAEDIAAHGLCLPLHVGLSVQDMATICREVTPWLA